MRNLLALPILFAWTTVTLAQEYGCGITGIEYPCCCETATCSSCEHIAACQLLEGPLLGDSPETFANSGGSMVCGADLLTPCSSWWENNLDGVVTDTPAYIYGPGGCLTSGCTDAYACNFDAVAITDDASCIYPIEGYCPPDWVDCPPELLEIEYGGCCVHLYCNNSYITTIGGCDEITVCQDPLACNYAGDDFWDCDPDNTSCDYAQDFYGASNVDCWGNCLNDLNNNGICDEDEQPGCTDPESCNYDPTATEDDGNCIVDFSISNLNGTGDLQVCPEEEVILNLQSSATTGAAGCVVNPFIVFDQSIYKQDTIFSIAARFTINQSNLYQNIYHQVSDGEMSLYYSPTDGLVYQTKASYGNCYTASGWVFLSTPIQEGIQYSMVATYHRGDSIQLFLDGQLKATSSVNDGLLADCDLFPAEIGQDSDNALTLDEIGFYNSILDESSISDFTGCVNQSNLFGNALTLLEFNSNDIAISGTSDVIIASAAMDSIESSCSCGHPAFNQALWSTGLTSPSLVWSATADDTTISVLIPDYPNCTDTIAITSNDATGCADPLACNFDSSAFCSLNCTYAPFGLIDCNAGASLCGENTIWNSTLQECVGIIPPPDSILVMDPSCGPGTVWDPINEMCIIAIPADLNYDGCVTVNDLLVLLAVHGTCPPYPEWPGEPSNNTWTCSDSTLFDNYWYETVLIGDQCWFAENLRTTVYRNGDVIPAGLTDGDWTSTTSGATAVYGEGSSDCYNYSPDIDACDETQSMAEYGRLYNWYAVDDARSLCPSGWHVPTDGEWTDLENHIRPQGFDGSEGNALKSTYGWYNGGNGTDDFGFSALPGGLRINNGFFDFAGDIGFWWSSSPSGGSAWYRFLTNDFPGILRSNVYPRFGFSVRCLRDAE